MELGRPGGILCASSTVLVGSMVDGKADFVTVGAVGIAANNPPAISIALQPQRYSLKGIRQNMVFSVNIPSADLVNETDYCGLASGARIDKAADCQFTLFYGALKNAPFIEQCPINHACEVVQILNLGSHELIVGRIVESHISEDCLTGGSPDPAKINPIIFTGMGYSTVGERIGDAFRCGIAINPEAKLDTLDEIKKMIEKEKS